MLVPCDECKQHYDDEMQKPECAGFGIEVARRNGYPSAHRNLKFDTAIEAHIAGTRAANDPGERRRRKQARSGAVGRR